MWLATICKHTRVTESVRILHKVTLADGLGLCRVMKPGALPIGDVIQKSGGVVRTIMSAGEKQETDPLRQDHRQYVSPM